MSAGPVVPAANSRRYALLVLLAVVGLGVGLNLRLAAGGDPAIAAGQRATLGAWTVRLAAARQVTDRQLLVSIELDHPTARHSARAGAFFSLLAADGSRGRPTFWLPAEGGQPLTVAFVWPARRRAMLRFLAPEGGHLDFRLPR